MVADFRRVLVRMGVVAALSLAVLALAACGSSAEPATEAPAGTAEPAATEGDQAAIFDEHLTGAEEPEPQGNVAPMFTLPDARNSMDVVLESYRGDKNVVLVFYRGFW